MATATVEKLGLKGIVLVSGFVFFGEVERRGTHYKATNVYNMRRSTNGAGFGKIALGGPTSTETMDKYSDLDFPETSLVTLFDTVPEKWASFYSKK